MQEVGEDEVKPFELIDKYAFISWKAVENKHIGYCYRERSDINIDSGWRFIFGDEDENYLDNPDNCTTMNLSELTIDFPAIQKIMNEKYNSEWEWDQENKQFEPIK